MEWRRLTLRFACRPVDASFFNTAPTSYIHLMQRNAFVVLSFFGAFLLRADVVSAFSWDESKAQDAVELVRQFQTSHKVPSVAIGIALDGQEVLAKGLDAKGSVVEGAENVRYRIASVSKQFTAAAILALIEDKAIIPSTHLPITLDTVLSDIFPRVRKGSELGKITVRQLLTMTSNLPNFTNDPLFFDPGEAKHPPATKPIDTRALIEHLIKYQPVGSERRFMYSNTNYFALALIIYVLKRGEHPPDTPPISVVRDYIRDRLFVRAGMTMSGFLGDKATQGVVDARPTYSRVPVFHRGAWAEGAGDIVSSVSDITRWNIALMSGKVIDKAMLRALFEPVSPPVTSAGAYKGWRYAMGWYVCDTSRYRLFQHDGIFSGFRASNAIGRKPGESWMSATFLANSETDFEFVRLVRKLLKIGDTNGGVVSDKAAANPCK